MDFKDKKVLVFGSGISGIGACELLEKSGATVILFDGNEKLHYLRIYCSSKICH